MKNQLWGVFVQLGAEFLPGGTDPGLHWLLPLCIFFSPALYRLKSALIVSVGGSYRKGLRPSAMVPAPPSFLTWVSGTWLTIGCGWNHTVVRSGHFTWDRFKFLVIELRKGGSNVIPEALDEQISFLLWEWGDRVGILQPSIRSLPIHGARSATSRVCSTGTSSTQQAACLQLPESPAEWAFTSSRCAAVNELLEACDSLGWTLESFNVAVQKVCVLTDGLLLLMNQINFFCLVGLPPRTFSSLFDLSYLRFIRPSTNFLSQNYNNSFPGVSCQHVVLQTFPTVPRPCSGVGEVSLKMQMCVFIVVFIHSLYYDYYSKKQLHSQWHQTTNHSFSSPLGERLQSQSSLYYNFPRNFISPFLVKNLFFCANSVEGYLTLSIFDMISVICFVVPHYGEFCTKLRPDPLLLVKPDGCSSPLSPWIFCLLSLWRQNRGRSLH